MGKVDSAKDIAKEAAKKQAKDTILKKGSEATKEYVKHGFEKTKVVFIFILRILSVMKGKKQISRRASVRKLNKPKKQQQSKPFLMLD